MECPEAAPTLADPHAVTCAAQSVQAGRTARPRWSRACPRTLIAVAGGVPGSL